MIRVLLLLIGYMVGCIQSAFIVGKLHGIDIRQYGSGNAGTTNVLRTLGGKAGATVFFFDFLKGFLTTYIVYRVCNYMSMDGFTMAAYSGIGVILGHNFPFYLKFKGGKGIACSMGFIVALNIPIGLVICLCGILVAVLTKYISLASICAAVLVPFIYYFVVEIRGEVIVIVILLATLAIFQHRANIKRLIRGEENKFSVSSIKNKLNSK